VKVLFWNAVHTVGTPWRIVRTALPEDAHHTGAVRTIRHGCAPGKVKVHD
jgi:hypothetical protein